MNIAQSVLTNELRKMERNGKGILEQTYYILINCYSKSLEDRFNCDLLGNLTCISYMLYILLSLCLIEKKCDFTKELQILEDTINDSDALNNIQKVYESLKSNQMLEKLKNYSIEMDNKYKILIEFIVKMPMEYIKSNEKP